MKKHLLLALIFLLLLPLPASAQGTPPIQAQVSLGMDGQCKFGAWLPVRVTLTNQGDDFTGELVIAYAQARHKFPLELATNAEKGFETELYINDRNPSQQIDIALLPEHRGRGIGAGCRRTRKRRRSIGARLGRG